MPSSSITGVIFKNYISGDNLSAAELNYYVMNQVVLSFASATERNTALTGYLQEGLISYLRDVDYPTIYNGSTWIRFALDSDIASSDTRSTLLAFYGSV